MIGFKGKLVLITDIDPEIGAEAANRLLQAGAFILVTGSRASEIISKRFSGQARIADTGVRELTTDSINILLSKIEQEHGGLDVIFINNYASPESDASGILDTHAVGMVLTLHKLNLLLRDGGAIVVCASFPHQSAERDRILVLGAVAVMRSFAQTWAQTLEARRIRVNAVSLYNLNPDNDFGSEDFDLSMGTLPSWNHTRRNTISEVASVVAEIAAGEAPVTGAEIAIVNGAPVVNQLASYLEADELGNPAEIVDNVVFLTSDLSRPLTNIELFPKGEVRAL
jgi:NAD(P)-dependent dehydrogenase (short-subunit alcohol dehydrogenase family)